MASSRSVAYSSEGDSGFGRCCRGEEERSRRQLAPSGAASQRAVECIDVRDAGTDV